MKKMFKILIYIISFITMFMLIICAFHHISNIFEKNKIEIPGDKIEIYKDEYIHSVKIGKGKYTLVFLPGMGTASPYYDYYKLANKVAENNQVIIVEPLGYGYSSNTSKKRNLKNYEYEITKILEYYNISENIILLNHSYSGIMSLYYANKHEEIEGIICLDCTTAYQIEIHVEDGKFNEEVPLTSNIYSVLSPLGLSRFGYSTFWSNLVKRDLLIDIPSEYHKQYKHLLYNKTMNKTIISEINDIPYNQLELLNEQYRKDLPVLTILSKDTIKSMNQNKKEGYFKKDWEEMHNSLISNNEIQVIYTLDGDHYIHHNNVEKIKGYINNMITELDKNN